MANPQKENGHIDIANEIAEAFFKLHLPANAWRVLWVILRQTYGWKKKADKISYTQFQQRTGLDRRNTARALKLLVDRNIIVKNVTTFITTYGFNKDYSQWKPLSKMSLSDKIDNETIVKIDTHKRKERKKNIADSKNKSASLPSKKKKADPRIKTIIDYFFQTCKEKKGFEPAINGKDAKITKEMLKNYPEETLKSVISFFLDSDKADKVGVTLSTAMSAHTVNLYLQAQSGESKTPENYFTKVTA